MLSNRFGMILFVILLMLLPVCAQAGMELFDTFNTDTNGTTDLNYPYSARKYGVKGGTSFAKWSSNRWSPYLVQLRDTGGFNGGVAIYTVNQVFITVYTNGDYSNYDHLRVSYKVNTSQGTAGHWFGIAVGPQNSYVGNSGVIGVCVTNNGQWWLFDNGSVVHTGSITGQTHIVDVEIFKTRISPVQHNLNLWIDNTLVLVNDAINASLANKYITFQAYGLNETMSFDEFIAYGVPNSRASVGAIRWDYWVPDQTFDDNLDPAEYHWRVPWFGVENSTTDITAVGNADWCMNYETSMAAWANLEYFACVNYYYDSGYDINYGMDWLSDTAINQRAMNYCFILQTHSFMPDPYNPPITDWSAKCRDLAETIKRPGYMRVMGGRPLIFWLEIPSMAYAFGSQDAAATAMTTLRNAVMQYGFPNPYIVGMMWPHEYNDYDYLRLDAVSSYHCPDNFDSGEESYDLLMNAELNAYWNQAVRDGKKTIPNVTVSYDPRPRGGTKWHAMPDMNDLIRNLQQGLIWVGNNTTCAEAKSIIMYAWNEHDEGGWLNPTITPGGGPPVIDRLGAIQYLLK